MIVDGHGRDQARSRFWCVDRYGLLTEGMPGLRDFQGFLYPPVAEVREWDYCATESGVGRAEVARREHPAVLIGTSTEHGAFPEVIVRGMPLPRELLLTAPPGRTGSPAEFVLCLLFKGSRRELR
jgi:malate dehydrogenase (oxaloacetate-decarboxylating)